MIGDKPKKSVKKTVITVTITCILTCGCMCLGLFLGGKLTSKRVAVDFTIPEETEDNSGHRYPFLTKQLSNYICGLCSELNLDPNLVVGILMAENPEFNTDAVHKNDNGTIDCGLFQLNDRYIWTSFQASYWFDNLELDPFNWKHNTYLAVHHLNYLQKQLKVTDDVIMAYNCGLNSVMNGKIPASTKAYLAKVKNNMFLLKENNGKIIES